MMKKTALLTALALMSASPAMAQTWKHLGSDGTRNHFFYKPRTLNVDRDNLVSAWTKREYNVDPDVMAREKLSPDMYKGGRTVEAFETYDCGKKKMKTLTGRDIEGGNFARDLGMSDWQDVAPGSLHEGLMNAICREGEKKMQKVK